MALAPREVPVTREQVLGWLKDWKRANNNPAFTKARKQYLADKLAELDLGDGRVKTGAHDDLGTETTVLEMILLDLKSYGQD